MKKILVNIIIFFLLGSNVAWAFDVGEQVQERETNSQYTEVLHESGDLDSSALSCDHCCHGNAHFLGVFSGQPEVTFYFPDSAVIFTAKNVPTTSFQPPTPPPNV